MANVPNYQGMFLRGYGSQSHTKNNGSVVGNTATSHASGAIGAVQGDAVRSVYHRHNNTNSVNSTRRLDAVVPDTPGVLMMGASREGVNMDIAVINRTGSSTWGGLAFDLGRQTPTANEIRPVNVAVRHLIRSR